MSRVATIEIYNENGIIVARKKTSGPHALLELFNGKQKYDQVSELFVIWICEECGKTVYSTCEFKGIVFVREDGKETTEFETEAVVDSDDCGCAYEYHSETESEACLCPGYAIEGICDCDWYEDRPETSDSSELFTQWERLELFSD